MAVTVSDGMASCRRREGFPLKAEAKTAEKTVG